MRFAILLLSATLPLAAVDQPPPPQGGPGQAPAGHDQRQPLTDAEKALFDDIRSLHQQIEQKRTELIALLEKDHPRMAAEMRRRMEEERREHEREGRGPGPGQGQGPGARGGQ